MKLKDLVGRRVLSGIEVGSVYREIYGCTEYCNFIKFTLDGVTYMGVENPEDGYRSYMEELVVCEGDESECSTKLPDIVVDCSMRPDDWYDKHDVLLFTDVISKKQILAIGTAYIDDYYPCCTLDYNPENMYVNEGVK